MRIEKKLPKESSRVRTSTSIAAAVCVALILVACGGSSSVAPVSSAVQANSGSPEQSSKAAAAPSISASAPASASGSVAKPSASKAISIKVANSGATATATPLWMAEAIHAFEKHGVAVTITQIANTTLTPAMINHEVDLYVSSGPPVLTADLNANLDEVFIGAIENNNVASLYVANNIKSAADLKGKVVGTDRPGTPSDLFSHQLLTKIGLQTKDVTIRMIGGSEVAVPAFIGGQIDAVSTVPPYNFQLEVKGYKPFATMVGSPYLSMGIVGLRSRFDELGVALPGFLAAIREGMQAFNDQPDLAKKVIQSFSKQDDPTTLQMTYDFFHKTAPYELSLRVSPTSLQEMLNYLGETTMPAAKNAKPEQFFDMRFVDQLPR